MYSGGLPPHHVCNSNRRIMMATNPRLYQVWKGSNIFFLGGHLIFGPDFRSLFLTVCLIVVPVILFCAFISQRIVNEFPHHLGHLIIVLPAVFTTYIIIILFLASGKYPVPRNHHPPEPDDDVSRISTEWAGSQSGAQSLPPTKEVIVNGMVVRVKYCQTCMLYRSPQCSHCSICNNCVERFDHHCPWVGQCIEKDKCRKHYLYGCKTKTDVGQ